MRVPSAARKVPSTRSTVTPAKFPTRCRSPVSALKSVVFPVLGLPIMATRSSCRAPPRESATDAEGLYGDPGRQRCAQCETCASHVEEHGVPGIDDAELCAFAHSERPQAARFIGRASDVHHRRSAASRARRERAGARGGSGGEVRLKGGELRGHRGER